MKKPTLVLLRDICRPRQWPTLSLNELSDAGFPVYGANGRIGYASSFTHEKPVLLVGCRGSCGSLHITEPRSYANGNAMALDELDEQRVAIRWLLYFLAARGFADVTTGTSQPQITQRSLSTIEVPLPTMAEQERIVRLLDESAGLCRLRSEAEERAATVIPALFDEMFGTVQSNRHRLPVGRLSDLAVSKSGVGTLIKGTLPTENDGTLFPAFSATGQDVFAPEYRFDGPGIVISAVGARCGKCFMASGKWTAIANTHVLLPIRERVVVEYIFQLVNNESFWVKGGTAQPFIKVPASMDLPVLIPPLERQQAFAYHVTAIRALEKEQAISRKHLQNLFQSLLHRAFSGDL